MSLGAQVSFVIFFLPALSKIELAGRLLSGFPCPRLALGCSGGHWGHWGVCGAIL